MQIRILLKQNNVNEAYELTNWVITLVNSIIKNDDCFIEEKMSYMYLKIVCEKLLKLNYGKSIDEFTSLINNKKVEVLTSNDVKFYCGDKIPLYSDMKDYKQGIKKEVLEDKDEHFDAFNEVFKEIFGGDIYE